MAVLKSQGLLLKKGVTAVGQLTTLDRSGLEAEQMETTDLSTTDKTYAWNGLVEPGTISGTLLFDPDLVTQSVIETDLKAGTSATWSITYTDGTPATDTFTATPTKFDITGSVGERTEATFEMKISGAITRA